MDTGFRSLLRLSTPHDFLAVFAAYKRAILDKNNALELAHLWFIQVICLNSTT
jgi:hypothetical protein